MSDEEGKFNSNVKMEEDDKEEVKRGDDSSNRCLFCLGEVFQVKHEQEPVLFLPGSDGSAVVDEQLWAFFVLRNLLNYPKEEITRLLQSSGEKSISEWFALCENCKETVKGAMAVSMELLKLTEQFKKFQEKVNKTIKNSLMLGKSKSYRENEMKEIREYFNAKYCDVNEVNYSDFDTNLSPLDNHCADNWSDNNSSCRNDPTEPEKPPKPEKRRRKANPKRSYVCTICRFKRMFSNHRSLGKHLKLHKVSKHPCPQCSYPCSSQSTLDNHLSKGLCSPTIQYKCDLCDFVSQRKVNLTQHQVAAHSAKVKASTIANKVEKVKKAKEPKKKKPRAKFPCQVCGKTKKNQQLLDNHLKMHQYFENCEVINGKLKCKICAHLAVGPWDLRRHTREHHASELNLPVFQCSSCEKSFGQKDSLDDHFATVHVKDYKFHCKVCGFGAIKEYILRKHLLTHGSDDNEKPFICHECGAAFKCEKTLRMHLKKTHNNAARKRVNFPCKYCTNCEVSFSNKSLLTRHVKEVHGDLFRFKCDQCENCYLSERSLKVHQEIIHSGEQVECPYCQRKILNRVYLRVHLKSCRKIPVSINQ